MHHRTNPSGSCPAAGLKQLRFDQGDEQVTQKKQRDDSNENVFRHDSKPPAGVAVGHAHGKETEGDGNKNDVLHNSLFLRSRAYSSPSATGRFVRPKVNSSYHRRMFCSAGAKSRSARIALP